MKKIFFGIIGFIFCLLSGCRLFTDDFANEEYIWENWNISTNRVETIEVEF